ncbi:MAG: thioredoxin family protein [Bacteroidales bacterium]|nr:thioredoxin family protein [Bacteroidales bacterium]
MKNSNNPIAALILGAAFLFCLTACSKAVVSGTVEGAPDTRLVASRLVSNRYESIDTLTTDALGAFKFRVDVAAGDPEFVYLQKDGRNIASYLLFPGDRVKTNVSADGVVTVTGSDDSALMNEIDRDYAAFVKSMEASPSAKTYVDYYRSRVSYIFNHLTSLTCIPVLYQRASETLPVFAQTTDALHFKSVSDTLSALYPKSRFVKALRSDAAARMNAFRIEAQFSSATPVSFPEIELPDTKGNMRKVSDVAAKVKILYFWMAANAVCNNYNTQTLMSAYNSLSGKDVEVYAVSLDPDKTLWASYVAAQNLPWINVNDVTSVDSRFASVYNVQNLPAVYLLSEDGIKVLGTPDAGTIVKEVRKLL